MTIPDLRHLINLIEYTDPAAHPAPAPGAPTAMTRRPVVDTPEFQRWFAGSKAVDAQGEPLVLYHGTSKDQDFKSFKVPSNGAWFASDPAAASEYARENDSMNVKYDHYTRSFNHIHQTQRVIPVFLKATKVKHLDAWPPEIQRADNYRKAQGVYFGHLRAEGYDAVEMRGIWVLIDQTSPHKIKSALGNKAFSDNKKNIHEDGDLNERASGAAASRGFTTDSPQFREWFRSSKVVDAQGNPLPVYHGTGRPDRVGKRFMKSRATSGPMAYFTDDPSVASGYATGKSDTSLSDDMDASYEAWCWIKLPDQRKELPLVRAWYFLPSEVRQKIAALAPRVTTEHDDKTGDSNIVLGDEDTTNGIGNYDYEIRQQRGNALAALVQSFLTSGHLFGEEHEFSKVLRLAGVPYPVRVADPRSTQPFVYKVFLSIQNPLDSLRIDQRVMDALTAAAAKQRAPRRSPDSGADMWDKRTSVPKEWLQALIDDISGSGGAHSWTTVPDWVTATLKSLGYDGIKDVGGKNGGQGHTVWIPFEETQVKSAIANKKFNPAKPGIHEDAADYRGEHMAPDKAGGCPLWDLTQNGIYPDDVYGPNGFRYYGEAESAGNRAAFDLAMRVKGKGNAKITVYRAVPKDPSIKQINPGDWVAITRRYAMEHGRSHLNGAFRVLTKMVSARDLFTDGNSIEEWGYDPQPPMTPDWLIAKRKREAEQGVEESAEPIMEIGEHDLNRCTSVSVNAILTHFKAILITNNEVPRTAAECTHRLEDRGLVVTPGLDDEGISISNFVQKHQRGVWIIGIKGHAMALVEGNLIDTENKGPDGRVVEVYAEVTRPGASLHEWIKRVGGTR